MPALDVLEENKFTKMDEDLLQQCANKLNTIINHNNQICELVNHTVSEYDKTNDPGGRNLVIGNDGDTVQSRFRGYIKACVNSKKVKESTLLAMILFRMFNKMKFSLEVEEQKTRIEKLVKSATSKKRQSTLVTTDNTAIAYNYVSIYLEGLGDYSITNTCKSELKILLSESSAALTNEIIGLLKQDDRQACLHRKINETVVTKLNLSPRIHLVRTNEHANITTIQEELGELIKNTYYLRQITNRINIVAVFLQYLAQQGFGKFTDIPSDLQWDFIECRRLLHTILQDIESAGLSAQDFAAASLKIYDLYKYLDDAKKKFLVETAKYNLDEQHNGNASLRRASQDMLTAIEFSKVYENRMKLKKLAKTLLATVEIYSVSAAKKHNVIIFYRVKKGDFFRGMRVEDIAEHMENLKILGLREYESADSQIEVNQRTYIQYNSKTYYLDHVAPEELVGLLQTQPKRKRKLHLMHAKFLPSVLKFTARCKKHFVKGYRETVGGSYLGWPGEKIQKIKSEVKLAELAPLHREAKLKVAALRAQEEHSLLEETSQEQHPDEIAPELKEGKSITRIKIESKVKMAALLSLFVLLLIPRVLINSLKMLVEYCPYVSGEVAHETSRMLRVKLNKLDNRNWFVYGLAVIFLPVAALLLDLYYVSTKLFLTVIRTITSPIASARTGWDINPLLGIVSGVVTTFFYGLLAMFALPVLLTLLADSAVPYISSWASVIAVNAIRTSVWLRSKPVLSQLSYAMKRVYQTVLSKLPFKTAAGNSAFGFLAILIFPITASFYAIAAKIESYELRKGRADINNKKLLSSYAKMCAQEALEKENQGPKYPVTPIKAHRSTSTQPFSSNSNTSSSASEDEEALLTKNNSLSETVRLPPPLFDQSASTSNVINHASDLQEEEKTPSTTSTMK